MIHENQGNPGAGAAPGEKEGGPAPKKGAHAATLRRVPDDFAPNLIGAIVIGITSEGLPIVQKYDRQAGKYRRWCWKLIDVWYTRDTALFEEVSG
jgi:hypothetical protein